MKKNPRECGARTVKVTCVAFHPKAPIVAQGYENGLVLLCRPADAGEILVQEAREEAEAAIAALCWDDAGRLLFGASDGKAGVLATPA